MISLLQQCHLRAGSVWFGQGSFSLFSGFQHHHGDHPLALARQWLGGTNLACRDPDHGYHPQAFC